MGKHVQVDIEFWEVVVIVVVVVVVVVVVCGLEEYSLKQAVQERQ